MTPTFSIITVVYNGATVIEKTIQSVLNQTFRDYEYLVIDGASKDETLNIVKKYNALYPLSIQWVSERDKGLYDAMNKGLRLAKGRFVLFLNAGDALFEKTTLQKIAYHITPETDVLFGETMLINTEGVHLGTRSALTVQKLPEKLTWQSMKYGMVVCHQSFLPARELAPDYIENNLAADIDWVIKCLQKANNQTYTHTIVSEYLIGGVSKQQHQQSLRDRFDVLKTHFGRWQNMLNHVYIFWRALFNLRSS